MLYKVFIGKMHMPPYIFSLFTAKKSNELKYLSFCVLSDSLTHDADAVHTFLSWILSKIKTEPPNLKMCIYFSDGATSQYKDY